MSSTPGDNQDIEYREESYIDKLRKKEFKYKEFDRKFKSLSLRERRQLTEARDLLLLNGVQTKYFFLDCDTWVLRSVNKNQFKQEADGVYIEFGTMHIKVLRGSKDKALGYLRARDWSDLDDVRHFSRQRGRDEKMLKLDGLEAEFMHVTLDQVMDSCKNFVTGFQLICKVITKVGDVKNKADTLRSGLVNSLLLSVCRLLISIGDIVTTKLRITALLGAMLDFYNVFSLSKESFEALKPEFGVETILAMASMCLPQKLFEIFKRAQLFSSTKLLDDASGAFKLYSIVLEYIGAAMTYLPFTVPSSLKEMLERLCAVEHYGVLYRCVKFFQAWKERPNIVVENGFRHDFLKVYTDMDNNTAFQEWLRRSPGAAKKHADCVILRKVVDSYEKSSRVEPACFVFEGPPGCMKTVTMTKLIDYMGRSKYCHITKSTMDGKDFFDTYNGEDIYYSDDVGIQGVSQWRSIINMVSSAKTPLDVAAANLKDTKFFISPIIMLTTNNFSNLAGVTRQDGIENLSALWRRGFVFDFANVARVGPVTRGRIQFKHFMPVVGWRNDFPDDFRLYQRMKHGLVLPSSFDSANSNGVIAWMSQIVSDFEEMKKAQHHDNTLNDVDRNAIREAQEMMLRIEGVRREVAWRAPARPVAPVENVIAIRHPEGEDIAVRNPNGTDVVVHENYVDALEAEAKWRSVDTMTKQITRPDGTILTMSLERVEEEIVNRGTDFCQFYFDMISGYWVEFSEFVTTSFSSALSAIESINVWHILGGMIPIAFASGTYLLLERMGFWAKEKLRAEGGEEHVSPHKKYPKISTKELHPSVAFIQRNVYDCDFIADGVRHSVVCVISGLRIMTVGHACPTEVARIIVYKDREANHILIDHLEVKLVKRYDGGIDLAVWTLPRNYPSPFKSLTNNFNSTTGTPSYCMASPSGCIDLLNRQGGKLFQTMYYTVRYIVGESVTYKVGVEAFTYDVRGGTLCGCPILSVDGKVLGMHVAGNINSGHGVAMRFSDTMLKDLQTLMFSADYVPISAEMSEKIIPDFSGIKLQNTEHFSHHTPKQSKIGVSPLYEVFPISRKPAELSKYGPHTVKDVAKKSFKVVKNIDEKAIEFGKQVMRAMIPEFDPMSMKEVIKGTDRLSALNKKSSNGFRGAPDKWDCVNFETGTLQPEFAIEYNDFISKIKAGESIPLEEFVWTETLKDELRPPGKDPRSFRVSTLKNQLLTKTLFGHMVENIVDNRYFNQIMVGVNPYTEFKRIYDIMGSKKKWAGDISSYDGNMLPQVQHAVFEIFEEKFTGDKTLLQFVVSNLAHCVVLVNDDLYMTTHSMPSGSFLTAILNSLINRFYTACWYYLELTKAGLKPSVDDFMTQVIDFVYGDDKLNAIINENKYGHILNAITMRNFFVSIGMNFTTSEKGVIDKPFQEWSEITFLKRSFQFNPKLGEITCPLDFSTLYSSLSFVSDPDNMDQIVQDKLGSFQRELFLHSYTPTGNKEIEILRDACIERGVAFRELPESYLMSLYKSGEYGDFIDELYGLKMK